jgi:hypothetical protein
MNLISIMLEPKPEKRATMEQVCEHPWLKM